MTAPRDAWLSLDEAAARWGVSRLRIREAIAAGALRAQRDNRGFWRVYADEVGVLSEVRVAPNQLLEIMFDEIEELTSALDERRQEVDRLGVVAARQQDLLERALTIAEAAPPSGDIQHLAALNERSHLLLDGALASLEQRDAALQQMNGLMQRALDTTAGLDAEVARQRETSEKQRALLDRVFELARASLDRLATQHRPGWFDRLRGRRPKS
jgi:excisionase family DNA binding protein